MDKLDLTAEELLSTTRSVRHRLGFDRPVAPAILRRCVELALQAPSGRNSQGWASASSRSMTSNSAVFATYLSSISR